MILTCSDKIVNSGDTDVVEFQMPLKFANGQESLAEVVVTFRVTIIADDDTIVANLEYTNGSITGLIENVPAGPDRTIIVEGLAADGTVIYRGTAIITVVAGQTVDAEITLLAVAKLARVSPNFVDGAYGNSFVSNIRVDNIAGLTAISLALNYNSNVIELDSVKAGADLPVGTSFSYNDEDGIEIDLSHSSSVVNSSGNAILATAFFTPVISNKCLDSTNLDLGIVTLTAPGVTLSDIFVDDGQTHISIGRLVVSEDTLKFGLGVSGLNLDFKKVDISDSCGNEIAYVVSTDETWIDLNTAIAGITPGSIFIDIDTSGLASGKYEGRVRISSSKAINSPYEIVVKLEIDRGARSLNISPGLINFNAIEDGAIPANRRIHVEELYQYNIPFNASEDAPWLTIDKTSGTTPDSIIVSINTTEMSPGFYFDTVFITSEVASNSPRFVRIQYYISPTPKHIEVAPDTLFFTDTAGSELPMSQYFTVIETEGYNTYFEAYPGVEWLTLSSNSGTTPDTISVSINSTDFEPGFYYSDIYVYAIDAIEPEYIVTVSYEAEQGPSVLKVEPALLYFAGEENGELPESKKVHISELNGNSILFNAGEEIPWLNIDKNSGTTPDSITVSVTTTELEPDTYTDTIVVLSSEADNSPQYISVVYEVTRAPRTLAVEPTSLHFSATQGGESPLPQAFRVFDPNGYSFNYNLIENIPWLSVSLNSGITEDTVTVNVNTDELEPGMYFDSIQIIAEDADNSPIYVAVSLGVTVGPRTIEVEPDSIHLEYIQYSDAYPMATFRVFESEGYHIPFSAVENIPWLFLSDTSGITEDTIAAYFASTGLDSGFYIDSLMITSEAAENDPVYVKVVLRVIYVPPPTFVLIPPTLYFSASQNGELPSPKWFEVFSSLYPTYFSATESIEWLYLTDAGGTTGNSVTVHINTTELDTGIYRDSILISTEDANFTHAYEHIVYTITPFIDNIPPSAVRDFLISSNSTTSRIELIWRASGDDGNVGTASETDIRYATDLETLLDWSGATQIEDEPAPQSSGKGEFYIVTGLTQGYTYYFALDIIDDAGNHSGLSNVDSIYLSALLPEVPILISPDSGATDVPINVTLIWHSSVGAEFFDLTIEQLEPYPIGSFISPLTDTILPTQLLSYGTTYYWAVRATNSAGSSDFSNVWSFTTISIPPTISGVVKDSDGELLADVLVAAYDDFPNGTPLDSAFTDANGAFSFFDINGNVELYTFKDGYYPQTASIEAPDTNVTIFLLPTPAFTPSDKWVDLYCDSSYFFGNLIQPNDVVEAFDPDGILCGRFVVHTEGAYGFMHVYRDEPETSETDEGCDTGDIVTLKVNGIIAVTEQPIVYPSSFQLIEACLNVTGEIPKWVVVLKPESGETFYQDSTISVTWSSTGISGLVEITLSQYDKVLDFSDTTENDGQHNFVIPVGLNNSDDWRIQVRDLDEPVSDYSNLFTISSVELLVEPANLHFHGLLNDCVLDEKQFTISEVNGFNIPFEIIDTVSWLSVNPVSGTTPAIVTVRILANDLSLGTFERALPIISNSAVNSPVPVSVELDNGQYLCGDFDNDCRLRITDLSQLVNYMYRAGSEPTYPDALNVDLCDGIDIADVDFLNTLILDDAQFICEGAADCASQSHDLGAPDSLGFVVAHNPDQEEINPQLQLDLYLFNDANTINGLASGFGWDNTGMILDSVNLVPNIEDSLSLNFVFEDDVVDSSNANRHFLLAANRTIFSGISPAPVPQLLASYFFTLSSWTSTDSIVVDTLSFSQGTTYKTSSTNGTYRPVWRGPVIIKEQGF